MDHSIVLFMIIPYMNKKKNACRKCGLFYISMQLLMIKKDIIFAHVSAQCTFSPLSPALLYLCSGNGLKNSMKSLVTSFYTFRTFQEGEPVKDNSSSIKILHFLVPLGSNHDPILQGLK